MTNSENKIEVKVERTIQASPTEVFKGWLNPKIPGTPWNENDELIFNPKVGGFFYWLIQGTAHYGRFIKLERSRLIQHTWMSRNTQGEESLVTVTFKKKGDDTLMTLVHSGLPDTKGGKSHEGGWTYFLDKLMKSFEKGTRTRK